MDNSQKKEAEEAAAALTALSGGASSSKGSSPPKKRVISNLSRERRMNGSGHESGNESDNSEGFSQLAKPIHAPPVSSMMVDHTYIDFSVIDEEELSLLEENKNPKQEARKNPEDMDSSEDEREKAKTLRKLKRMFGFLGPTRKNSGGVVQPFPEKLMEVLDRDDMDEVLSWMPHGRAFIVKQPKVFEPDVLPRIFKQSKFTSFTRQLNLWGFKRITKGPDAGAYYHELFLRGRPKLCSRMRRQKIKGTGIKLTPNPDMEPNFYDLAKERPLAEPKRTKKAMKPLPITRNKPNSEGANRGNNIDPVMSSNSLFPHANLQQKSFPLKNLLSQSSQNQLNLPMQGNCYRGMLNTSHNQQQQGISSALFQQSRGMDFQTQRRISLLLQEQRNQKEQEFRQMKEQLKMQGLIAAGQTGSSVSELKQQLISAAQALDQFEQGPRQSLNPAVLSNTFNNQERAHTSLQNGHCAFGTGSLMERESNPSDSRQMEALALALQQQQQQTAMLHQLVSELRNQRQDTGFIPRQLPTSQLSRSIPMSQQGTNIRGLVSQQGHHARSTAHMMGNLRRQNGDF